MAMHNGSNSSSIDSYSPKEMAAKAEKVGVTKAGLDFTSTLILSVLAGAFIAFGACFYTTAITGNTGGLGLTRVLGGVVFSVGLILVVVAGAELFTGNALMVMALLSRRVTLSRMLRNWGIVYIGNLVGSLLVAYLAYHAWQWKMGQMAVGISAYNIAGAKLSLPFATAFCSGILCNILVCLAVWLCYSARSTTDKILAIVLPIAGFVAMGFEHSVANMYFIPYGIMLAKSGALAGQALKYDASTFTVGNFLLHNLLPVTLGNIVGGVGFVGISYWTVYLRGGKQKTEVRYLSESVSKRREKIAIGGR